MADNPKPRGRPRKQIDLKRVESMASYACTQEEISKEMGFDRTLFTIREDVGEAYATGFTKAKTRLRVAQFRTAEEGNPTMLIWLGKQYLGQHDGDREADKAALERLDAILAGVKDATVK